MTDADAPNPDPPSDDDGPPTADDLPDDAPPSGDGLPAETRREIGSFVRNWLADEGLPGASVAVVRGEECVYADGFGSRDLADNRPATADTLYGVGSVTKSFAALAVMQLAEAGDLDVDDPVRDHVDLDFPEGVRLHHLLTHSSGLPSLGTSEALIARRIGMGERGVPLGDREDFYAHVGDGLAEMAGDPGEQFRYCNAGYVLLGDIVEAASGRSFASYVEAEILTPLGMDRSTFSADEYRADDDAATPYLLGGDGDDGGDGDGGRTAPEATEMPVRELSAAPGGLLSSVRELARYVAVQRSRGAFEGTRLADPASFDRMHAGHVETDSGPYGYGWRRREVAGETVVGHAGSVAVSTAYVGFTPDDEWGVAILCNGAAERGPREVADGVFAALLGGDPADAPAFARRDRLDELAGTYESYQGIRTAEVSKDGGTLRLAFTDEFGDEGSPLIPKDDSLESREFYRLGVDGTREAVAFDASGDGVDLFVDRWRLHKK